MSEEEWMAKMSKEYISDSEKENDVKVQKKKRKYPVNFEDIPSETKEEMARIFFKRLEKRRQKARELKEAAQNKSVKESSEDAKEE